MVQDYIFIHREIFTMEYGIRINQLMARIYLKMDNHIKVKLKMENKDGVGIGILMVMYIKENG